ncbi:MAG: mechanosensitive ion channel family protein [Candidatus Thermoplasmatota archaeon]|nr:mechanosensitive ion channel family protein [Candidatus Thermoplasmatota archaeon]MBU4071058.1 mechanosensitive ion channel family protein [Candidatus Thermoplasmatota archaeon]MBU4143817.1 mechanosensitive ion channel family protein [Candidatus Thermoplasmatota archaeon]MBU4591602.1 mechanosensitive ion channel family protein [Candidatus Thermoplasmatota archaeon]
MPVRRKPKGARSSIGVAILALALGVFTLLLKLDMDYDLIPYLDLGLEQPFQDIFLILTVLFFVWFSLRLIGYFIEIAAAPRVGSYGYVRSTWKIISYSIWAIVLSLIFFYSAGGFETAILSIGLIGAALTFVLQKPLLNLMGWIFITYNKMYTIGDRVSIGEVKGYVTDIMAMNTALYEMGGWMQGETFTGRVSLVPNGMIFDMPIYNYTRDSHYIWDEVTNMVTYESDIDMAKKHMLDAAIEVVGDSMQKNHDHYKKHLELHDLDEAIPDRPTLRMALADSGVKISVVYWLPVERRRRIRSEIVERVWRKFSQDSAVEIAYPHMELVKHNPSSEDRKSTE